MYLYDSKTSQALEDEILKNQESGFLLMMRAASCILSHVKKKLTGRLWCIAGPGNNCGDAIATAALALVENIDVGGPTMARAAAKNYNFVTVIT